MGTQAILGTPLQILKKRRGWYYVQTPDEYLGWTDDHIVMMTPEEMKAWSGKPKVIVTTELTFTRQRPEKTSQTVSDVVAGALLALKGQSGGFYEVEYPDGRTAFARREMGSPMPEWLNKAKDTPETIVATAQRFMGLPYFWGGTSAKGMDCSGFTKTVYFLNGVLLPRDASQQVLVGELVDTTGGINLKPGDLLFFGSRERPDRQERVTHVAISLGGKRFIHASTEVRINSLSPGDADYSEHRDEGFLRAKRIIGVGESAGVKRLKDLPYYGSPMNSHGTGHPSSLSPRALSRAGTAGRPPVKGSGAQLQHLPQPPSSMHPTLHDQSDRPEFVSTRRDFLRFVSRTGAAVAFGSAPVHPIHHSGQRHETPILSVHARTQACLHHRDQLAHDHART